MRFWIWIQEIKMWIQNQDFAYNSHNFGLILMKLGEVMSHSTGRD